MNRGNVGTVPGSAAAGLPARHLGRWDGRTPVGELPARAAARWGGREALVFGEVRESFADVARRVDEAARGLIGLGVAPGEKVCLWLDNSPEWIHLMFALARIGAILVPANTRFRAGDVEYLLRQGDCATLITHDVSGPIDYLGMVRELVPESLEGAAGEGGTSARGRVPAGRRPPARLRSERFPALERIVAVTDREHPGVVNRPALLEAGRAVSDAALAERARRVSVDDTLFIMFTSGTTGFPKGVMRNHHLLRNLCDRIEILAAAESDVVLNFLPLFHLFGCTDGPLTSMMAGSRQVLTAAFDPDECIALIEAERVTRTQGFDIHLKALMDAQERRPHDVSSLRVGFLPSGMASSIPIARRSREVFPTMRTLTAYGSTEGGANVCMSLLDSSEEQRCETSGRPCDGFEIRIVDPETGAERPAGAPGEILVRSYNLMQGYYRKPAETAAAIDAGGWLHSGDLGYLREDGYLRFLGRCKDMLKVGGENVDPVEVEQLLLGHPGVREAAVVGFPDERLTEVGVAFVVAEHGAEAGGEVGAADAPDAPDAPDAGEDAGADGRFPEGGGTKDRPGAGSGPDPAGGPGAGDMPYPDGAPDAGGRRGTDGRGPGSGGSGAGGEALARDLLEYGRGRIASFKLPRHVLFIDALPMTSSGKVRKAELRALAAARLAGGPAPSAARAHHRTGREPLAPSAGADRSPVRCL